MKNITHIIFDLDGLLIDSEMWAFNCINLCLSKFHKECHINLYRNVIGFEPIERCKQLIETLELKCDETELLREWYEACIARVDAVRLMPGVVRLVEHFHHHSIPMAIASAGKSADYYFKTKKLQQIFEEGKYFSHVVHRDDSEVKRSKPFPDLFEVCANRFVPKVEHFDTVLVFEDSRPGIRAAIDAGMPSVLVCDKRFATHDDQQNLDACHVINSLEEFKPELFGLPSYDANA